MVHLLQASYNYKPLGILTRRFEVRPGQPSKFLLLLLMLTAELLLSLLYKPKKEWY